MDKKNGFVRPVITVDEVEKLEIENTENEIREEENMEFGEGEDQDFGFLAPNEQSWDMLESN